MRILTEQQKIENRRRASEWYKNNRSLVLARQKTPEGKAKKAIHNAKFKASMGNLKSRYGVTREQFTSMLGVQGGVCAVCGGPPIRDRRLSVDHNHATGQVRSLLCIKCNAMLGNAKERPETLRKGADYLESFAQQVDAPEDVEVS